VLVSLLLAVNYRVDESGGPEGLAAAVAEAFALWQEVPDADFTLNIENNASNIIRYGDGNLFGPDAVSLSVVRSSNRGREVVALIHPDKPAQRERALLHETGALLGLRPLPNQVAVMNPSLAADAEAILSDADRDAISALGLFPAEDLNRDGAVNFYDLAEFAAQYDQESVSLAADLNGDGVVNDEDINQLREAYVFSAPAETDPAEQVAQERLPETDFPDLGEDPDVGEGNASDVIDPKAINQGLAALEDLLEPPPAEPDAFIGIGEVALPAVGLQLEGTPFDPEAVGRERLSPSALRLLLRLLEGR
jgi:hypothetical protein